MSTDRIKVLTKLYLDRQISEDELNELAQLISAADDSGIDEALKEAWLSFPVNKNIPADVKQSSLQSILGDDSAGKVRRLWYRWAAAAAILLLLSTGAYFWFSETPSKPVAEAPKNPVNDVLPGKEGAILILADGRKIVLDSLNNGVIATQGNTTVQLKDKEVVYENTNATATETVYNTMTTPKGRQFQVVLPDGTKVWLNAASILTYPTAFVGKERRVAITGEAYFEVAGLPAPGGGEKGKGRWPFIVEVNGSRVEVLGTHFNVMAYQNESTLQTTLLEGSVRFINENKTVTLKPGQQSQLESSGNIKVVEDADVELAVAWKNGVTAFKSADIKTIMRQVERWYDVDVHYEGNIPERGFTGEIPRDVNLSSVLKLFEVSKIRFTIDAANKKLTVRP